MSGLLNSTGAVSGIIGTTSAPAVGTGTDGYVWTATGAGVNPAWEASAVGGKILQVQVGHKTTTSSSTSADSPGTTSGLAVAITPASASSKIYLHISIGMSSGAGGSVGFDIYSSLTSGIIGTGSAASSRVGISARSSPNWNSDSNHGSGCSFSYNDAPTSWSSGAITYTIYMWGESGTTYMNRSTNDANNTEVYGARASSSITAMEYT